MLKVPRIIRAANKGVAWLAAFALWLTASVAAGETLMMPDRPFLMGANEVVWGITTLPNFGSGGATTTYSINFGDGSATATGNVTDRSYIAVNHVFALAGTFTVTLTVTNGATTENATSKVSVYNPASLSAFDLRNVNINRTIENGLRFLWVNQSDRGSPGPGSAFDTTATTSWNGEYSRLPWTALVVLAFENHGYRLPNDQSTPTGLYQKYLVQRGLNYVISNLVTLQIGTTPQGDDPCVNVPAATKCIALVARTSGFEGYENGIAVLPFASSGASNRMATLGPNANGINVNGMTYGEIMQRLINASAWGQNDKQTGANVVSTPANDPGRGGWIYNFNGDQSDGSTDGWELFAMLDAGGAGAVIPPFVKSEWSNFALPGGLNNDGTFDYRADGNPASDNDPNVAKTGVGIQGMFFAGRPTTDAQFNAALAFLGAHWNEQPSNGSQCRNGKFNKGCSYGMINTFKGLKLYGVQTLPGVARAAGPGPIPADDWYADYVDYLVANQANPLSTTGGNWPTLRWSCCADSGALNNPQGGGDPAVALLILAPVALLLPDPTTFSTLGLQQGNPLSTNPMNEAVNGSHTVTAVVTAQGGAPVPGATVTFNVISGPNAGKTGQAITAANGQVTFTYPDTNGLGTDQIQASIGNLTSNILSVTWINAALLCDANADGKVDATDLAIIRRSFGASAGGADVRDTNGDGLINIIDYRFCVLHLTPASP